jgi:hypothetical protein
MQKSLSVEQVLDIISDIKSNSYVDVFRHAVAFLGRSLTRAERETISAALRMQTNKEADMAPMQTCGSQVVVFTAYSSDYSIGKLCEAVNRVYAHKHGYIYEARVMR